MTPGPDLSSSPSTHSVVQQPTSKCRVTGGRDGGSSRHLGAPISLPYMTSNSRNSMSITNTKGLLNMPGQNNCFLNSAVQVLWHLDIFRRSFRELTGHACMAESCIFCALKELFAQFQYSQESALPPDALRRALAETFSNQRRFQLGFMDDAAECFENILLRIHFHIANKESEDMCSASHCIPHQKFAMTLVEQTVCHACGATSEPLPFTQMVHYVPSSALCSQAKVLRNEKDDVPGFGELLKKAGGLGDLRDCPSACGTVIQIRRTLMNRPEIVSIGLVWDSERPTIDHIMDVFSTIGMTLKLQDVFHSVVDSRWASTAVHHLVGIVTYYGKHYSTFFFHTKLRVWIYFDDAAVREIGPKWEQVVDKCCRGHFQPLLLLYANPYGTSISTSTAPHDVIMVSNDQKFFGKDMKATEKLRPTHHGQSAEGQSGRRAVTPNPEASHDANASIQPRRAVTPSGDVSHGCFERDKTCNLHGICAGEHRCESSTKTPGTSNLVSVTSHMSSAWQVKSSECNSDAFENMECTKDRNFNPQEKAWPLSQNSVGKLHVPCDSSAFSRRTSEIKSNSNSVHLPISPLHSLQSHRLMSPGTSSEASYSPSNNSYEEDKRNENAYISRRAVENVLHLQKLQRQKSVTAKSGHAFLSQRNSNSSLESLENIYVTQDRNMGNFLGVKFDIPESVNIPRRRDSGNWSGDRNSASSSSTTSLDNPHFYAVGNKRPFCNGRIVNRSSAPESTTSTDPGYDSFSLSSSDSYPSVLAFCPGKVDPRLGQILENQQTAFSPCDMTQLQHCVQDLSKKSENHIYGFRDECEKLCIEADIFLAKSVERENIGDISMAALLSDSAAAKARAAMDVPYSSPHSLSLAKLKHSMCIIRSCNLQKKLKEAVAAQQQKKEFFCKSYQNHESSQEVQHTDQSSCKKAVTENHGVQTHVQNKCTSSSVSDPSGKNIEIYATLPKKSLKKKSGLLSFVESLTNEDSSPEKGKVKSDECSDEKPTGNESVQADVCSAQCRSSSSDSGSTRSFGSRRKSRSSPKSVSKDSDLSDYSSEWEQSKKSPLYRTYSGPPVQGKETPRDMSDENHQLSSNQTKKQHKIRRKLIGGFMRRKNRSLPDLREGQDQANSLSRAYDDCDISQVPLSLKMLNEKNHKLGLRDVLQKPERTVVAENLSNSKLSSEWGEDNMLKHMSVKTPNISASPTVRTHTPPPYKPPPPPVTGTGLEYEPFHKRFQLHAKDSCNKPVPPCLGQASVPVRALREEQLKKSAVGKVDSSPQSLQVSLAIQSTAQKKGNCLFRHNSQELPRGSAIWLKELQLKQEELNQKKKLQEEQLKQKIQNSDFPSRSHHPNVEKDTKNDMDKMDTGSSRLLPKGEYDSGLGLVGDDLIFFCGPSANSQDSDVRGVDHTNSVRYLASKFEKIMQPSLVSSELYSDSQVSEKSAHSQPSDASVQSASTSDVSPNLQLRNTVQRDIMFSHERDANRIAASKVSQMLSPSACVYSPHLSDGHLTNVLRIGVNCASPRSTNSSGLKDIAANTNHLTSSSPRPEIRRPEKPPDYETALQRLELIRGDRNHVKHFDISRFPCIDISLLEPDKRRRSPKKSVTFSDKVVLVACAGDEDNDFLPNPLLERVYKQHLMQNIPGESSANSVNEETSRLPEHPVTNQSLDNSKGHPITNSDIKDILCNLCHNKSAVPGNIYCTDCAFYMSRFQK